MLHELNDAAEAHKPEDLNVYQNLEMFSADANDTNDKMFRNV